MFRVVVGVWVLLAATVFAGPAYAQLTDAEARRATRIARTTQSPFCPGKTLDACPSPSATEWRADIRVWVEQGVPDREIRERLQTRVPQVTLDGEPMGESSWWLPLFVGAVATAVLLAWAARHVRRERPSDEEAPDGDADGLDARLQRELDSLDP